MMKPLSTTNYFPNLDGLRFFAFFVVFINHASICLGYYSPNKNFVFIRDNFLKNGDIGVSFFFVLSGFLITYLLLKEKETLGKINIKHFYIRRVLRIFPLYYFVVVLGLYVIPMLNNHLPINFPMNTSITHLNPYYYLTFTGNFDYLKNGISNVFLGVLWSVSVEEQFYLFWCPLIAFLPRKYLMPTFIFIIIGSIGFRYFYSDGKAMILKFHSLSVVTYLAMGAVIAHLSTKEKIISKIKTIPKYLIVIIYIIGIVSIPFRLYTWKLGVHYILVASFIPVFFAAFFAFIIMEQNFAAHSFYKISGFKFISSMGKYTYGMYCYHMMVFFGILFGLHLLGVNLYGMSKFAFVSLAITSFFATCLVSVLSYHYFEMLFLKLKGRFSSFEG